jgi:hypothetical protein
MNHPCFTNGGFVCFSGDSVYNIFMPALHQRQLFKDERHDPAEESLPETCSRQGLSFELHYSFTLVPFQEQRLHEADWLI